MRSPQFLTFGPNFNFPYNCMKNPNTYILQKNKFKPSWVLAVCLSMICLFFSVKLSATVQGGALLNGSTHSDNSAVITNSDRAIKWSGADLDGTVFEFNASHPTRLKVKAAGDYFVSLNAHSVENSNGGGNNRTQHRFVLHKNGTIVPQGKSNCTFLRHHDGHAETSGHINVLVPGLSANDYFEIYTGIDYAAGSTVKLESVRLFAEKVAPSRTVFAALSNRTTAHATELRHDSLTPLENT